MEHCTLEQLRKVTGHAPEADYEVPTPEEHYG
jgi:hypothetical protein